MKMLRADHGGAVARPAPVRTGPMGDPARGAPMRRGRPRKGFGRRFLEEAFDLIEDIFD
jgi:hypothetical protein